LPIGFHVELTTIGNGMTAIVSVNNAFSITSNNNYVFPIMSVVINTNRLYYTLMRLGLVNKF